jgi:hypothetical protein
MERVSNPDLPGTKSCEIDGTRDRDESSFESENTTPRFSAARDSGGVARIRTGNISCPKVSAVLHFRRQLDGGPYGLFPGKGETIWGPFFNAILGQYRRRRRASSLAVLSSHCGSVPTASLFAKWIASTSSRRDASLEATSMMATPPGIDHSLLLAF